MYHTADKGLKTNVRDKPDPAAVCPAPGDRGGGGPHRRERKITMRIAGFNPESIVDGPGVRPVLYVQGCTHACKSCHNPSSWALDGGQEMTVEEVADLVASALRPLHRGVTFSGGEPFLQAADLARVADAIKLPVMVYTGFVIEELLASRDAGVRALLERAEILVDGRFVAEQKDLALIWRGSHNQRLIDVPASLRAGKAVEWTSLDAAG